jgi:AraC-like DNA-binding protein
MRRARPSPLLEGAVTGYTGYSHRSAGAVRRREPAQAKVTVILGFGPALRVEGPGHPAHDAGSFVAPLTDSYAITQEGEALEGVQVDLSPLGAHMLFGIPMHELSELVVDLEAVLGASAPLLVERLATTPDWGRRFALLDSFIASRLERARPPSPDVAWAWQRLSAASGMLSIGRLAEEIGCSRRHLAAGFREQIGPTQKTAARILRFRRAVDLISRDDGRRFAEIAQTCGYYDQAHLNREFRQMSGATPVTFLQDPAAAIA